MFCLAGRLGERVITLRKGLFFPKTSVQNKTFLGTLFYLYPLKKPAKQSSISSFPPISSISYPDSSAFLVSGRSPGETGGGGKSRGQRFLILLQWKANQKQNEISAVKIPAWGLCVVRDCDPISEKQNRETQVTKAQRIAPFTTDSLRAVLILY